MNITPRYERGSGSLILSGRTKIMESNAAMMVLRPALKTGFSEMGWGSTPLLSAKQYENNNNNLTNVSSCCYRMQWLCDSIQRIK